MKLHRPGLWRSSRRVVASAVMVILCLSPVTAHEFWVEPSDYTPELGEQVLAALKVGQMMSGADFPYLSNRFQSFTLTTRRGVRDVMGHEGDSPAVTYAAETPGLHVIAYHSTADLLTFESWEQFTEYLDYEGLGANAAMHRARGFPTSGFTEAYTRCAKALVQVGPVSPQDVDQAIGLPLELVAAANPYARGTEVLPVTLTWQGALVAGAQIAVFRRSSEVTRSTVVTDAEGRAEIPLAEAGEYLLNAVYMEPVDNADVVWQSHWASLSFETGDN